MHINRPIVVIALVVMAGCWREIELSPETIPQTPGLSPAIVDGYVVRFNGGGTVEMNYPPGLRLAKRRWLSGCTDSTLPIYLAGVEDSSCISKWVRAFGSAKKIRLSGSASTYVYYILELRADSIRFLPPEAI